MCVHLKVRGLRKKIKNVRWAEIAFQNSWFSLFVAEIDFYDSSFLKYKKHGTFGV